MAYKESTMNSKKHRKDIETAIHGPVSLFEAIIEAGRQCRRLVMALRRGISPQPDHRTCPILICHPPNQEILTS